MATVLRDLRRSRFASSLVVLCQHKAAMQRRCPKFAGGVVPLLHGGGRVPVIVGHRKPPFEGGTLELSGVLGGSPSQFGNARDTLFNPRQKRGDQDVLVVQISRSHPCLDLHSPNPRNEKIIPSFPENHPPRQNTKIRQGEQLELLDVIAASCFPTTRNTFRRSSFRNDWRVTCVIFLRRNSGMFMASADMASAAAAAAAQAGAAPRAMAPRSAAQAGMVPRGVAPRAAAPTATAGKTVRQRPVRKPG